MIEFKLTPIEKNGQRMLTTAQLAEAYSTSPRVIKQNFNNNTSRYKEGIHFYCLKDTELSIFKNQVENFDLVGKNTSCLYLWTERGSLLHAKSINTDEAWEAYDYLIEYYFRTREIISYHNDALLQLIERQDNFEAYVKEELTCIRKEIATVNKSDDTNKVLKAHDHILEYYFKTKEIISSHNDALLKLIERQDNFEAYVKEELTCIHKGIDTVNKSDDTNKALKAYDHILEYYFKAREITSSYNDTLLHMIERIKALEQKIDALEKKSWSINKDTVNTLIMPFLYQLEETIDKSNKNIICSIRKDIKLLSLYINMIINKIL